MKKVLYKALESYLTGNIDRHRANILLQADNPVGVAEHSDHVETIEKELGSIAEYEDKLQVLRKYFGTAHNKKEVLNG
tara:strand:+ start:4036 stop:4269 length:234 start_codon:yes stop_codon:yes gene_type:complete